MQYISETLQLTVSAESAFKVLPDLNVILRLSPYWSVKEFKTLSDGIFDATIEHYGKDVTETHRIESANLLDNEKISFRVGSGMLKEINFVIEKSNEGVRLTQQFLLDCEDETVLKGTRSELHFWLRSIGEYLKLLDGKTLWRRFLKWFMDRVWLKLSLSERKIAIILTTITLLELVLLILLVLIWNLFVR